MHDIYDSVMAEVKRHGFWRPCYGRVRFKVPWISPAYGYWWPGRNVIRVGRLSWLEVLGWFNGARQPSKRDIIRHELGHVVLDKNRTLATRLGFDRVFGHPVGYSPRSHVSEYAATHAEEDFAETLMLFLKHRGRKPWYLVGVRLARKWRFIGRLAREINRQSAARNRHQHRVKAGRLTGAARS
jgi:hypothetical protein